MGTTFIRYSSQCVKLFLFIYFKIYLSTISFGSTKKIDDKSDDDDDDDKKNQNSEVFIIFFFLFWFGGLIITMNSRFLGSKL